MVSVSSSRSRSVADRNLNRPADLHLEWSASKEAERLRSYELLSSSVQPHFRETPPSPPPQSSVSKPSHPFSSFQKSYQDQLRIAAAPLNPSASTKHVRRRSECMASSSFSPSPGNLLKSGYLTWRSAVEKPIKRGALNGFEKALRRRQAAKDRVPIKLPDVFVTLEQIYHVWDDNDVELASNDKSWDLSSSSSEPFMVSPHSRYPSAFEADRLLSLESRPSFPSQNKWTPPSSWAAPATPSDGRESHSRSTDSSMSDPLQTPRSSPPSSPREDEVFLSIFTRDSVKLRSMSKRNLQMRLRITRSSTIEMQSCPLAGESRDESTHIRPKQLVITGEAAEQSHSHEVDLTPSSNSTTSAGPYSRRPSNAVCILSSADLTELNSWLDSIERAIDQCRGAYRARFERRRSSAPILDTTRLFEQLESRTRDDGCIDDSERLFSPIERCHPSNPSLDPSAREQFVSPRDLRSGSEFTTSAFIDYYASKPTSAVPNSTSTSDAHYSFEDTYSSIIRRFADARPSDPYEHSCEAPSDRFARQTSSDRLDVPVSPCSYDFSHDEDDEPSSPVDPWLSRRAAISATSLASGVYGDDTVRQIFAEGFRF